jgi:hypothetical protein
LWGACGLTMDICVAHQTEFTQIRVFDKGDLFCYNLIMADDLRERVLAAFAVEPVPFPAQENGHFLQMYRKALLEHDYIILKDFHADVSGQDFLASHANMQAMKESGHDFLLLELPDYLNSLIEQFESGAISFEEFEDSAYRSVVQTRMYAGEEQAVIGDLDIELAKQTCGRAIEAVHNAQKYGIRVRFFDKDEYILPEDSLRDEHNAHIDDSRLAVDRLFSETIEELTGGKKSVILAGAAHVDTNYGIDEYLRDRGRSIFKFELHGHLIPLINPDNLPDSCARFEIYNNTLREIKRAGDLDTHTDPDLAYDSSSGKTFDGAMSLPHNCPLPR